MSKEIEVGISVGGTYLTVSGYYYPEEDPIMYDSNMEGCPGCAAEFELQSVQIDGKEIIDLISDAIFDEIVETVINNFKE
jgi:hypothetical protein